MTKIWLAATTSLRATVRPAAPTSNPGYEVLQRRMGQFGVRRGAARSVAIEAPPLPLDFHLLADGEALEAAWQTEIRLMIVARRGGAEARAAARAARTDCEEIVGRIERARALTLDGLKVKARAESWRRDGQPLAADPADAEHDEGVWTDMADLPRYDAPAPRTLAVA